MPRKTTEVRLEGADDGDPVERAHTWQPALVLLEGELAGQVFRLRHGRQLIGRRPECEIRVRERAVSGVHAEVIRDRDAVTVNDLASTNGTLVNGVKIRTPAVLTQGSVVTTGSCVFRFIDSLLEVEFTEQLHARGITDQLTGACNRAWLVARLGFAIDTASPLRPVSVIAFDFDGFKQVNDTWGHAAGDHVLREIPAAITSALLREGQLFSRVGGEEFVILLPDTPPHEAMALAEEIRALVANRSIAWNDASLHLTASFGVASTTSSSDTPDALLARADEQLYAAKHEGRNRVSG